MVVFKRVRRTGSRHIFDNVLSKGNASEALVLSRAGCTLILTWTRGMLSQYFPCLARFEDKQQKVGIQDYQVCVYLLVNVVAIKYMS